MIAIICLESGILSSGVSLERRDYVPVICTHRPSLLPIGTSPEELGVTLSSAYAVANFSDRLVLEEAKVVTRLL